MKLERLINGAKNIIKVETESEDAALRRAQDNGGTWKTIAEWSDGLRVCEAKPLQRQRRLTLFGRKHLKLPSKYESIAYFTF